jgi:hypothetical protein
MKVLRLITIAALVAALFTQCIEDLHPGGGNAPKGLFTVTIENVSEPYLFFQSGVATVPSGETEAGPALPGHSFSFSFHAGPNHKLSFATMYGWSNDGFYAPDGMGIGLYDGGSPVTGDITSKVMLWDAGTEMNQMPGAGNMHDGADESGAVQLMSDVGDGYDYGMVGTNLKVTLAYDGNSMFTVTVDNLAGSTTAISPVVWVVHTTSNPLFEAGMADYGKGLESVAETGNAAMLVDYLAMNSGYVSPIAPGVWVVHHHNDMPIFTDGMPDTGMGLEQLSEMGDPSVLAASLMTVKKYESGVYNTPEGAGGPGPLFPGDKYVFSFEGKAGEYLSFASMLGASNDLFFGPGDMGIRLFNGPVAISGDITDKVLLWDAGTEVNEYPGAQTQANTVEDGNVRIVDDGFIYPDVDKMIKVTIWKN